MKTQSWLFLGWYTTTILLVLLPVLAPILDILIFLPGIITTVYWWLTDDEESIKLENIDPNRVRLRELFKNDNNLCDVCGKNSISRRHSRYKGYYCGTVCHAIENKNGLMVITFSILLLMQSFFWRNENIQIGTTIFLNLLITGILAFLVFLGIDLETASRLYRRVPADPEDSDSDNNLSRNSILHNLSQNPVQNTTKTETSDDMDSVNTIRLNELDETIRVCCYQTARIGDTYCACGRAVDSKIADYVQEGKAVSR